MFDYMTANEWRVLMWGILLFNLGAAGYAVAYHFRENENARDTFAIIASFPAVIGFVMTTAFLIYRASLALEGVAF